MTKDNQVGEGHSLVSTNIKYQTRVMDDGRLVEKILDRALCDDGRILILRQTKFGQIQLKLVTLN
ncbi:MAG: hypothetical protein ACI86M_002699 [Saprospiraceae bacterium]|jgi:hypothetical protein